MRRVKTTVLAVSIIALAVVCPAGADINYGFGQDSYTLDLGATVSVPLYLWLTGEDLARLNSHTAWNGLASAGVRLQWADPLSAQPAQIAGPADIAPNTADFDMLASDPDPAKPIIDWLSPGDAGLWLFQDIHDNGVMATLPDPSESEGRVYLGAFTITAGLEANQTTTFIASDFDIDTDNIVTISGSDDPLNPGIVLDSDVGQATFTITSIPEPATTLAVVVLAGCHLTTIAWRRRK